MISSPIELANCTTFVDMKSGTYVKGQVYNVEPALAKYLLGLTNDFGEPYFRRPRKEVVETAQVDPMVHPNDAKVEETTGEASTAYVTVPEDATKAGRGGRRATRTAATGEIDTAGDLAQGEGTEV